MDASDNPFDQIRQALPKYKDFSDEELIDRMSTVLKVHPQDVAEEFGMDTGRDRSAAGAGLSVGLHQLGGLGYEAAAATAEQLRHFGLPTQEARDWLTKKGKQQGIAAKIAGRPDLDVGVEDVWDKPSMYAPWLTYQAAQQVPQVGGAIAAGLAVPELAIPAGAARLGAMLPAWMGGGALAGRLATAGADKVAQFAARRAALEKGMGLSKQLVGGAAFNAGQSVGSLYQEAVEAGRPEASEETFLKAIPYGLAETLPEAVLGANILHGGLQGNILKRMAKSAAVQGPAGATSEYLQGKLEQSMHPATGPGSLTPEQIRSQDINNPVIGGLVEGLFGLAGGVRSGRLATRKPTNLLPTAKDSETGASLQDQINQVVGVRQPMTPAQRAQYEKELLAAYNEPIPQPGVGGTMPINPAQGIYVEPTMTRGDELAAQAGFAPLGIAPANAPVRTRAVKGEGAVPGAVAVQAAVAAKAAAPPTSAGTIDPVMAQIRDTRTALVPYYKDTLPADHGKSDNQLRDGVRRLVGDATSMDGAVANLAAKIKANLEGTGNKEQRHRVAEQAHIMLQNIQGIPENEQESFTDLVARFEKAKEDAKAAKVVPVAAAPAAAAAATPAAVPVGKVAEQPGAVVRIDPATGQPIVEGAAPAAVAATEPAIQPDTKEAVPLASEAAKPPAKTAPAESIEITAARTLLAAVDKGGIPLNPTSIRVIAEGLGLEVHKGAPPEHTIARIREALTRHDSAAAPTTETAEPIKTYGDEKRGGAFIQRKGAETPHATLSHTVLTADNDLTLLHPQLVGATLIQGLDAQKKGQGDGNRLLKHATDSADKDSRTLVLVPAASGGLTQEQLKAWYTKNGFVNKGDYMVRQPAKAATKPVARVDVTPTVKAAPAPVVNEAAPVVGPKEIREKVLDRVTAKYTDEKMRKRQRKLTERVLDMEQTKETARKIADDLGFKVDPSRIRQIKMEAIKAKAAVLAEMGIDPNSELAKRTWEYGAEDVAEHATAEEQLAKHEAGLEEEAGSEAEILAQQAGAAEEVGHVTGKSGAERGVSDVGQARKTDWQRDAVYDERITKLEPETLAKLYEELALKGLKTPSAEIKLGMQNIVDELKRRQKAGTWAAPVEGEKGEKPTEAEGGEGKGAKTTAGGEGRKTAAGDKTEATKAAAKIAKAAVVTKEKKKRVAAPQPARAQRSPAEAVTALETTAERSQRNWEAAAAAFPDLGTWAEQTSRVKSEFMRFEGKDQKLNDAVKVKEEFGPKEGQQSVSERKAVAEGETYTENGLRNEITNFIKAENRNVLRVVPNVNDIPPNLRKRGNVGSGTQALTIDGKVWLIANRIRQGEGTAVFMHEVGAHLGLESQLTARQYSQLVDKLIEWSERNDGSLESTLAKRALQRVENANTRDFQRNSEMVAYFTEEAVLAGLDPTALDYKSELGRWFRKLWAMYKAALRHLGFINTDKLTAQEVVNLAYGAARLEMTGQWHGTAAHFRVFNNNYIGTGEGNTTYGWGTYLAQVRDVAKSYWQADVERRNTEGALYIDGKKIHDAGWQSTSNTKEQTIRDLFDRPEYKAHDMYDTYGDIDGALWALTRNNGDFDAAVNDAKETVTRLSSRGPAYGPQLASAKKTLATLETLKGHDIEFRRAGSTMRVDSNVQPDELLDWDAKWPEQSPLVRAALEKLPSATYHYDSLRANKTGANLYMELVQAMGGDKKKASMRLNELGIKGVQYYDQASRHAEDKTNATRNLVIFDAKNLQRVTSERGAVPTREGKQSFVGKLARLTKEQRAQIVAGRMTKLTVPAGTMISDEEAFNAWRMFEFHNFGVIYDDQGRPRFEISDKDAKWKLPYEKMRTDQTYKLSEVLDHPSLYKAYPELRNVTVQLTLEKNLKTRKSYGSFSPASNTIELFVPEEIRTIYEQRDLLGLLLHETQHWIQEKEGFARGGAPENYDFTDYDNNVAMMDEVEAKLESVKDQLAMGLKNPVRLTYLRGYQRYLTKLRSTLDKLDDIDIDKTDALGAHGDRVYDSIKRYLDFDASLGKTPSDMKLGRLMVYREEIERRIAEYEKAYNKLLAQHGVSLKDIDAVADMFYRRLGGEKESYDVMDRYEQALAGVSTGLPAVLDTEKATTRQTGFVRVPTPEGLMQILEYGEESLLSKGRRGEGQQSVRAARAAIEATPEPIRKTTRNIWTTIKTAAKNGMLAGAITEDIADLANKDMPSVADYINAEKIRNAEKTANEIAIENVLKLYDALPQRERGVGDGSVNVFIHDSTMEGKWGYKLDPDSDYVVDPEMGARFKALSKEGQALVRAVFAHGQNILQAKKQAVVDAINAEYADSTSETTDPKELAKLQRERAGRLAHFDKLLALKGNGPYAPLKRFGKYVAVGKSQAYLDAEDAEDRKEMDKLIAEGNHYHVEFANTQGEADAIADELRQHFAEAEGFAKETPDAYRYANHDMFLAFAKMRKMLAQQFGEGSREERETAKHMDKMLRDMYLSTLAESSARKTEFRRRSVTGASKDMMRSFATQGRADAHFIASVMHNDKILDALQAMRDEAKTNRRQNMPYLNEMLMRHGASLEYRPHRVEDAIRRFTSVWMLATSPAFYLQQLTQTYMMSLPVIAGQQGYFRTEQHLRRAYSDLYNLVTHTNLTEHINWSRAPADVRDMLQTLTRNGKIDIGIDVETGSWATQGNGKASKVWNKVDRVLRGVNVRVESINRATAAIAAYRTELARQLRLNTPPADAKIAATKYAEAMVHQTHGSYDGFNTPRLLSSAFPGARTITQFRRFQIIQLSLLARLTHNALKGENSDVRAVARRSLYFTLSHTAVMGGLMGMPGAAAIMWMLNKLFRDPDDPEDLELKIRRAVDDQTLADLLLNGAPAAAGVNLSGKLGMGQVLSLLPFTNIDFSRKGLPEVVMGALGPAVGGLLPRLADGVDLISKGEYYKGTEQLLPNGFGNAMKGLRFATDGVTMRNGDVVIPPDQLTMFDTTMQGLGLPTTDITHRTAAQQDKYEFETFYHDREAQLKNDYIRAYKANDTAAMQDIRNDWQTMQESRVKNGFKREPLSTLLKAPAEQRKRERHVAGGVEWTKSNRHFVEDRVGI